MDSSGDITEDLNEKNYFVESDLENNYTRIVIKWACRICNSPKPDCLFHSSQFQGMCSTKSSSETLQNLPYFIYSTKTQSCFFRFSFHATLYFYLMNALVYVNIEYQGIHLVKYKVAQNEKQKKQLWVFMYI